MKTQIYHLTQLFRGVRDVRETVAQYCLVPDMRMTSIDDLKYGFEQTYNVEVKFFLVPDLRDDLLRGAYFRFGDKVEIYIDENLSPEWRRYIAVKEMCHLILSDEEYMTADPTELLELMLYEEAGTPKNGEAPKDLVVDMWAKYAAHELLFPRTERPGVDQDLANGTTLFSISQTYAIPEHVIEWVLREDYSRKCDAAWDKV